MQAAVVLQGTFVGRVQERMQKQDERKGMKKSQQLMGDGLPKLLSADVFYNTVVDQESTQDQKEADKAERKTERQRYGKEMGQWKQLAEERNTRVAAQSERYKQAVAGWERERASARTEQRKIGWEKPKKGRVEPVPSKPKLKRPTETTASDEEEDNDNDGEENHDQPDLSR
ncbi:hypothetical protein BD309DRAFT_876561 [Dichomitus squalens]|nr:hypothetical protein BD309DRAFT_876561 [Dichomitus squalens]